MAALAYAVNECRDDLEKHCSEVEAGERWLLACLKMHEQDVSGRCLQALKDVGLEK